MAAYIQFMRGEATDDLLRHPTAFVLLALIAQRARRDVPLINPFGLQIGEALVGDHDAAGLTRQEFRTAIESLKKWGLITTRTTNKGTIASLASHTVFDINAERKPNQPATSQQPASNQQPNHQTTTGEQSKSDTCDEMPVDANQHPNQHSTETQPDNNQTTTTNKNERTKEARTKPSSLRSEDAADAAALPEKKIGPESVEPISTNPASQPAPETTPGGATDVGTPMKAARVARPHDYDPADIHPGLVLPFNTDAFRAAWANYRAYRVEALLPRLTGGMQEQEQLRKLGNLASGSEQLALDIISQTIERGYKNLYKLDEPRPQHQHGAENGATGYSQRPAAAVHANTFGVASQASLAIARAVVVGGADDNYGLEL